MMMVRITFCNRSRARMLHRSSSCRSLLAAPCIAPALARVRLVLLDPSCVELKLSRCANVTMNARKVLNMLELVGWKARIDGSGADTARKREEERGVEEGERHARVATSRKQRSCCTLLQLSFSIIWSNLCHLRCFQFSENRMISDQSEYEWMK